MIGRRVYVDYAKDNRDFPCTLLPGDYGADERGIWWAVPPGTELLAGLAKHSVTEHADGTITVAPSIAVSGGDPAGTVNHWHGFLERGAWRTV